MVFAFSDAALAALDRGPRRVCLEFANTMAWHASENPQERLLSYGDLVGWGEGAGLLSRHEARELRKEALARPAEAARALERAIELRETVYRVFVAMIGGVSPAGSDLSGLNEALGGPLRGAGIGESAGGFSWTWKVEADALDRLMWPLAWSAARLLASLEKARVGQCADDRGCGWLFLDTSRNGSRRWCDINDCGNRAKQRRHYARIRTRAR